MAEGAVPAVITEWDDVPGLTDDSDDEQWAHLDIKVGSMDVIRNCLDGIGTHAQENGTKGLARHATTIRIGRDFWQSAPLSEHVENCIEEGVS